MSLRADNEREDVFTQYLASALSSGLYKARPATEGDERYVYCEPSNENIDGDGERILQKALAESREDFLRFGNIDIEHLSLLGHRLGIRNPQYYQIGHPVDVRTDPIVVKGVIYRGEGEHLEQANFFWKSLTEQVPPRRWYPSVGGQTLERDPDDPSVVTKVRWTNLAFAKEPVNKTVKCVTVVPPEVFAKAVMAGHTTDTAALAGGEALRRESLGERVVEVLPDDPYRALMWDYVRSLGMAKACVHAQPPITLRAVVDHFHKCAGLEESAAMDCAGHFLAEIVRVMK